MTRRLLAVLVLFLPVPALAQQPVSKPQAGPALLTVDRIFAGGEFHAAPFPHPDWLPEGAAYTTFEPSADNNKDHRDLVRHDPATGKREVLVPARQLIPPGGKDPLHVEEHAWSKDLNLLLIFTNSQRVWRSNTRGDFWVLDRKAGSLHKLGGDAKPGTLMFAKLSPDGTQTGYVRENNLYVEDLATHKITRLTADGGPTLIYGTSDWVYEEELFLRDCWLWSPDGRAIAYWQFDITGVPEYTLVNYTDAAYPKLTRFPYPKTGEKNSAVRVGVVSSVGGPTRWLDVPGDPREHYLARMEWAASSDELLLQQLNRLQNQNRLLMADAHSGKTKTLFVEKDDAWVDIPENAVHWLEGGKTFTWISEHEGWRMVYLVARDGTVLRRLTDLGMDVIRLDKVDEAGGWIYYAASPENPTQRYLYRSPLRGDGKAERVTPADQPGTHGYQISADARWAVHDYSRFGVPPRHELVSLPAHEVKQALADNAPLEKKLESLRHGKVEFFRVQEGHKGGPNDPLDCWMMKPPSFDPAKKYPVLFHVYGEPWGQTVLDSWGGNTYLWHLMLTQQGYLVASVDNRGTPAPRGRAWRKVVYRKLGVLPAADQAAAVREIEKERLYVDPARVGIWGWSGGGSMSLNAIFRYPDLYKVAMAVAPVPDMRLYDSIYQERYMGLPQQNAEDYKQGSPITFAGQLKGDLLIVHGTGDDNVHYQGTERLANALVAADKPFTLMAYPNRSHGIYEGPNTTRHLFKLLTRYLEEHLPPGPRQVAK